MTLRNSRSVSKRSGPKRRSIAEPITATPQRVPGGPPPSPSPPSPFPPYFPFVTISEGRITLPKVHIGLGFYAFILPGKPIPITVSFWAIDPQLDLGSGCRIRILNGTDELLVLPQDGGYLPYTSTTSSGLSADIGSLNAVIQPPAPFSMPGIRLYQIGWHSLEVEVTTNGADSGPYTDSFPLYIFGELISSSWWSWGGSLPSLASWKEQYDLSGTCTNLSDWSGMQFTLVLDEQRDTGAVKSVDTLVSPHLESQETSSILQFPPITQDWEWLEPGVWTMKGAISHQFNYIVNMSLQDDYGNQYSPVASTETYVLVEVSDKKVNLATAAFASFTTATILTVIAGFFPWVGVAAAAAGIAASVLGAQALDPRPPSPRFLETVEPATYVLPKGIRSSKEHPEAAEFFLILFDMLSCLEALVEVEARLSGARESKNVVGIKLQRAGYRRIVQKLISQVRPLMDAASTSSNAIVGSGVFSDKSFKRLIIDRRKLSHALSGFINKIKASHGAREAESFLVSDQGLVRRLYSADGLRQLYQLIAMQVINVAIMTKREQNALLAARVRAE